MVGAVNHSSTQQLLSVSGVSHAGRILRVISLACDGCTHYKRHTCSYTQCCLSLHPQCIEHPIRRVWLVLKTILSSVSASVVTEGACFPKCFCR